MGPWLIDVTDSAEIEPWLAGGPPHRAGSVVMVVLGDSPSIRGFIPNALDAAKADERRVVVWIKDAGMLEKSRSQALFGDGASALAAVLSPEGKVACHVADDRIQVKDAEFAFAEAEKFNG